MNLRVQFNPDKYIKTGCRVSIANLEIDEYNPRLIISTATGRRFWCFFSEVITPELGINDPAISILNNQLHFFTFPMIDRFISELEVMLFDVYKTEIKLTKPQNHIKK